jgi:hypothetical protein
MKITLKILSLSIIIGFLAFNSFSQETEDPQPKVETQEEQTDTRTDQEKFDEAEVRKFLQIVVKELNEKKDIGKLSEKLLVSDFRERTVKRNDFIQELVEKFLGELNPEDKTNGTLEFLNAANLFTFSMKHSGFFNNPEQMENMKTFEIVNTVFPAEVLAIVKKNRFLNAVLISEIAEDSESTESRDENDDDESKSIDKDPKIENLQELRELISTIKDINAEMRKYIDSQSDEWKNANENPSKIEEERADYFSAKPCEDEDCDGLQKGQMIYHVDSFPFCVRIINEFGSYKVLDFRIDFGD